MRAMTGQDRTAGDTEDIQDSPADDPFWGRMNSPVGAAAVRGPCGEEVEFYLDVRDNIIEDVKYYTEGCEATRTCGRAVARRAKGKTILDALAISPRDIIDSQECMPEDGRHCAILAVSALYRAIADFMLQP